MSVRPFVYAHRGASAVAPANSLRALALARALGADGMELDLHLCGSGEVVVFHDDTLRGHGLDRAVTAVSLATLRTIDLGGGERIPTLEELLEAAGPEFPLNLELKQRRASSDGLERAVARVLARHGVSNERIVFSSFSPFALARMAARRRGARLAFLFHGKQSPAWRQGLSFLLRAVPGFEALHPERVLVTPALLAAAHRAGLRVRPWTVDDPSELARLFALGVDAVITNHPERALRVFADAMRTGAASAVPDPALD